MLMLVRPLVMLLLLFVLSLLVLPLLVLCLLAGLSPLILREPCSGQLLHQHANFRRACARPLHHAAPNTFCTVHPAP